MRASWIYLARFLVTTAVITAVGCAPLFAPRSRPAPLTGEWLKVGPSAPGDSQIMILRKGGIHRSFAVTTRKDGRAKRKSANRGLWYLESDSLRAGRTAPLCFVRRPGRDGATCRRAELIVDPAGGPDTLLLSTIGHRSSFVRIPRSDVRPPPTFTAANTLPKP